MGLHYTHVTIEGEPAQAAQLFTTMIATAFFTEDMDRILDAGLAVARPPERHTADRHGRSGVAQATSR